ncbi:TlpA family protein disulfide reductase [Persephonella sp.]
MKLLTGLLILLLFFSNGFSITDDELNELIGNKYKTFRGIDESGKVINIKSIVKKGKPAVIIFFAIGDKPGTFDFLPKLNPTYEKYKDKVTFVAVLLSRSSVEEVKKLKELLPLKIPVILAFNETIDRYKISKVDVPYIVFVDKSGKIKRIILRPESPMIKEKPDRDNSDYENKTQKERIDLSIKRIESYLEKLEEE